jgi:hypothetical protein
VGRLRSRRYRGRPCGKGGLINEGERRGLFPIPTVGLICKIRLLVEIEAVLYHNQGGG